MVLTLAFGLAQWRDELRRDYYTRAQAAAPTKIWHQVVVYPVMGYWLWTACITGLSAPGGAAVWTGKAVLVALVGTWAATNVYDRRHPKLGHPPFDWRRGRPRERPWAADSQTLEAATGGSLEPDCGAANPAGLRSSCEVLYRYAVVRLAGCWTHVHADMWGEDAPGGTGSQRGRAGPLRAVLGCRGTRPVAGLG
jgi:hypothetical protein